MEPVTKYTKQIVFSDNIPSLIRQAFRLAEEERPGAVHLELPEDVAKEQVDQKLVQVAKVRRPIAEGKAIKQATKMIEQAKRPLLIIGAGANRKQTSKMLKQFINKTGIPFADTQMGKGVIDERHKLFIGTAALSENDYVHCAIDRADLIINVGHDTTEKPPFIMGKNKNQQVLHLNFFAAEIDKIYFPQLEIVGDIANAIWQIKENIRPQKKWDFSYYLEINKIINAEIKVTEDLKRFPLTPQYIVEETRKAMPANGILALDNGMYKIWFARHYKAYQ
jgi:acetolactate synthase-1/2/3 large subunit